MVKKTLDQLQAEFLQDAEALATLQNIYAEKVKQIRTNRALPPDIQQRFLVEWEQFYDQRVGDIFSYGGNNSHTGAVAMGVADGTPTSHAIPAPAPENSAPDYGVETLERRPSKKNRG